MSEERAIVWSIFSITHHAAKDRTRPTMIATMAETTKDTARSA